MPSAASEEDSRQAKLAKMRKALEEAGVDTVSRTDAHASQVEAENTALRVQVSSLSAQLAAAQQSSAFFRKLFFSASRERVAADKRAKSAGQQTAFKNLNSVVQKHEFVNTQDSNANTGSAIAAADTSTCSSANPSSVTNAFTAVANTCTAAANESTAAANTSTAAANISTTAANNFTAAALSEAPPATATEAALNKAWSVADKLRLSAQMRVHELSAANASLQSKLLKVSADFQQAEIKMDRQDSKFVQADKMRQRAEEDLSGVAAERNRLLRRVSDLMPEQAQANSLPSPAHQDTHTHKEMPDVNCLQQTLPTEGQNTTDQTCPETPITTRPQAPADDDTKQFQTLHQTDDHDPRIPAVNAGQGQLQGLQTELESKQEVIEKQAADITDAAVKMSAQQGVVQQLRADLRAKELAALLFHVRLVPTKVSRSTYTCKGLQVLSVCYITGRDISYLKNLQL